MNNQQRGDVAQTEFTRWCARVEPQMVPVLAHPDRFGWDYLVTLSLKEPRPAPRENGPTEPQCKVQVKAAMPEARSVSIKLSNWERMVKEPMPWFVAAFRFPKDDPEPMDVFVVPVGRELVSKVLARLRRNDLAAEGVRRAPEDIELEVAFGEDDRVTNPAELRARIEMYLGPSASEYARTKQQWIETVGYDEARGHVVFSTRMDENRAVREAWAEWSLGRRGTFRVEGVRAERVRFNLAGPLEGFRSLPAGTITLHSRAPVGQVLVTVSDPEGSNVASVTCAIFTTGPVARLIPTRLQKLRLTAPFVEFLFSDFDEASPTTLEGGVSLPDGAAYVSLENARRAARLALVMAQGRTTGYEIRVEGGGETKTVQVNPGSTKAEDEGARLARLFDVAGMIAQHVGLDVPQLQISPAEMARREGPILTFGATLDSSLVGLLRVGRARARTKVGARAIWPFPCVVYYDTHVVGAIVTVEGMLEPVPADVPDSFAILAPTLRRYHQFVARREGWDQRAFRARLAALVRDATSL